MAKNWMVSEVAKEINVRGFKTEEVQDFGRRFPITSLVIARTLAGDTEAATEFFKALPDYVTMGKMEKFFKEGLDAVDADDAEVVDETTEEKKEASGKKKEADKKPADDAGDKDLASMKSSELWELGKSLGIKTSLLRGKDNMIKLIKEAQAGGAMNKPVDDEEEDAAVDYSKKGAKELYKMAKDRGIEVEQKKPAKYYIDKLEAADAADAEDDEAEDVDYTKMTAKELYKIAKDKGLNPEQKKPVKYYVGLLEKAEEAADDEEEWGDDEEEVKEEKKPATSKGKGKGKKTEVDEEDEWDI